MIQAASPFKFLDSYQEDDIEVFFGREKETEEMYDALSGVKHLLVYGPSGVGKTSLVECGLRNQFSDADWYALTIRRGSNIVQSVYNEINKVLDHRFEIDPKTHLPIDQDFSFGKAVEHLFSERYQPIYLIFDQFEELLIANDDREKEEFFEQLNQLIRHKIPCRVLLIIREEFIGHLSEFEYICPTIFHHRFRLEKMRVLDVRTVVQKMLQAPKYRDNFTVKDSELLAKKILEKLPDNQQEIELAHVQVFLSELFERASMQKTNGGLPLLYPDIVKDDDNLAGVLESFLKKQIAELDPIYGTGFCLETLAKMISEKHTKLQMSVPQLQRELEAEGVRINKPLAGLLEDLRKRQIVRPLKSEEETQYEISHDILAKVVGQNLTEEMKLREKATDVYRVYKDRQGLLSQDDLDHLRMYQKYRDYPEDLKQLVDSSKAELENQHQEELRKTKTRLRIVLGLCLLAMIAGVAAFVSWRLAVNKTREANENLVKAYEAEIQRHRREVDIASSNIASLEQFMVSFEQPAAVHDTNQSTTERIGNDVLQIEKAKKNNLLQQIDSLENLIVIINSEK